MLAQRGVGLLIRTLALGAAPEHEDEERGGRDTNDPMHDPFPPTHVSTPQRADWSLGEALSLYEKTLDDSETQP